MDQSTKPGIQPLPLGQPFDAAKQNVAASAPPPSLDEKVDEWVSAHPDGKGFDEPKPVGTTDESATPTEPTPTEPPGGATAEPIPPVEAPPAGPPSTEPTAAPQAQQPKVEEKPVAAPKPAEPIRFSLDAKYRFVDNGPEWSGQQVVDALRERQALIPRAQEADVYREVFEMPAAQAKEMWAPNIAWLRQNPESVQVIASMIDDPQKAQYIAACSQYWDSPEGHQLRNANAGPQQQQVSPEIDARFKQLEAQNKQLIEAEHSRKSQAMHNRISRELNTAFERYPYLRDNPAMVQALLARAYWINGGDDSENSRGVLDALEMERDLYDSKLTALNAASSIARDAATPAPAVPPLMGTAGASPQASVSPRSVRPKQFTTLDDAVEDWMSNPPSQFR
jgi:hypothetical protein